MARHEVLTPVPGTFYRRPDPDSDPFFSDGDTVSAGDVIGLVEIMKNFQDVEAEVDGTLVEFLVENEDAVQAGQAVAVIDDGHEGPGREPRRDRGSHHPGLPRLGFESVAVYTDADEGAPHVRLADGRRAGRAEGLPGRATP